MSNRAFSERLNSGLDEIGVPEHNDERIEILAKLIKVPRFKAEALLSGNLGPEPPLLKIIANELEVNEDWLMGKSERRQN
jgi:hypothetical protein